MGYDKDEIDTMKIKLDKIWIKEHGLASSWLSRFRLVPFMSNSIVSSDLVRVPLLFSRAPVSSDGIVFVFLWKKTYVSLFRLEVPPF